LVPRLNHGKIQQFAGKFITDDNARRRRDARREVYSDRETPMKYRIALQKTEEGYSVSVPGLPGCWSQGATEEEALANIEDAIKEYLAAREELLRDSVIREVEVPG
jgi:predicted RNase H-like HicB family nuclease